MQRKNSKRYNIKVKAKVIEMYVSGNYTLKQLAKSIGAQTLTVSLWIDKYLGVNEQNKYNLKSKV